MRILGLMDKIKKDPLNKLYFWIFEWKIKFCVGKKFIREFAIK